MESMTLTADSFSLRIDPLRPVSLIPDDLHDFLYEVCGEIVYYSDGDQDLLTAGRFRIYYVNFQLAEQFRVNPFEILDLYQQTNDYAHVILDSNKAPFSTRLEELLDHEIWGFNLLILDRIEILPEYRGHGIGLLTLISLIQRFGEGAGVVGMKPFPLQFEPKENRNA
jgi:GNAT superfamily N-acetyltransferase